MDCITAYLRSSAEAQLHSAISPASRLSSSSPLQGSPLARRPAAAASSAFPPVDHAAVEEALHICDLEDIADRQISALSGGQQQRAFLARAWAQKADIYLLDEPFTGLDRNAVEAFAQAMRRLREAGKLIMASHHDLKSVEALFDHILLLNGELVACGPTAEAFTKDNLDRAYAVHVFSGHAHHHHP